MSQEDTVGPLPSGTKSSQFPRLAPHSPAVLPSPAQSGSSPAPAGSADSKFTYPIDAAPKRFAGLAWKERIFLLATLVLVPTFGVFLRRVTAIVSERVEAEEALGVQPVSVLSLLLPTEQEDALTHPRFIDFVVAVAAAVLLSVVRQVTSSTVFKGVAEQLVNRTQERTFRVARSANALFKLSYFVVITYWGFRVLGDQDWFPTVLGGHGHFREAWARYPETNVSVAIKRYYLLELGYHIHALFFHVFLQERKNDFLEMLLHHFIAMFLVSLSYILNYQRAGSVILILHDMADIFVYASKASVDSRHTYLTLSCYAGMLSVWGFARLYVLPFYVVYNCWFESFDVIHGGWFLVGMLSILQCLHIYWYYLFILMGYHYFKRGETVDIQEKAHHTDGTHAAQPPADSAEKRARGKAI